MRRLIAGCAVAILCGGCATNSAAKMVKALGNDPAGFSLNVDTLYGKIHLVRANPGSNTPPYRLSPDGGVQVLETTQGAAPAASQTDVILQTLKKVPNQPEVR